MERPHLEHHGGIPMKASDVKVCVIRIEGTNCEDEMAEAFRMVGAFPEKVRR